MALACVYPDPPAIPAPGAAATLVRARRRTSVGQSAALVKRGSRVRIPPSAWLYRAASGLIASTSARRLRTFSEHPLRVPVVAHVRARPPDQVLRRRRL